jgi:endonuclease YncB( thermonuclease family)
LNRSLLALTLLLAAIVPSKAQYVIVDGDTVKLGKQEIRAYGYDAAEIFHPRCGQEKTLGLQARQLLVSYTAAPHKFRLRYLREKKNHTRVRDKYGRYLAVYLSDGQDIASKMIASGTAVPYFGTGARKNWCTASSR